MASARPRPMPIAAALLLACVLATPAIAPSTASAAGPREPHPRPADSPRGIRAFMHAMSVIESGGWYDARNRRSGAIGRYQIMPSNWPAWARRYVGSSRVPTSAAMQDQVARGRLTDLFAKYRRWDLVAYWWLTGRDGRKTKPWSKSATRYVANVMAVYKRTAALLAVRGATVGDGSSRIHYEGGWRVAHHRRYGGGSVRYASRPGATATITFTGSAISWVGPMGPTRGLAKVFLDGRPLRQVQTRARSFGARRVLFEAVWPRSGRHTLTIMVLATAGRRVVALDEVIVRR